MITCEHAQNLFDAHLNDELSATLSAELNAHLLDCAACQHQLSLIEACGNVIRLDTSEPAVSGDFTDRLMAIIEQDAAPPRRLQLSRAVTVAGGLLGVAAAISLAVVFYPPTPADQTNVLGTQVEPPLTVPTADGIAREHFGFPLFDALERSASVIELGDAGARKLFESSAGDNPALPPLPPGDQDEPDELDVTGTLPDLGSDGEEL